MEIIAKLGSLLGLSFISGINLYATVAVVGICAKFHLVGGLPPEFDVLANDFVIFIAIVLYVLEFFIDKIPGLDTLWDTLHSLIRPLGGAMMALIQVGDASPATQVVAFMVGASLASMAHATKAGSRLIINTSPEPVSNILASLTEDAGAIGFSYLSLAHPQLAFFLTLAFVGIIAMLMPLIFRTVRMLFSAILFRLKCFIQRDAPWEAVRSLPYRYDECFESVREGDEDLLWTGKTFAVKVPKVPRFTPMQAAITTKGVRLFYNRRFRTQDRFIPLDELKRQKTFSGALLARWSLKTAGGDLMLCLYQPLAGTLPRES
ncbi:MAG: DUF4126 domain-containing protein, partial [Acidobacteriota bacterium]